MSATTTRRAPEAVVAHAAALLGMPPPPLVPLEAAGLSPMARSFYDDNKRVSNRLIKTELGVTLRYPDLPRRPGRDPGRRGLPKNPASGIVRLEDHIRLWEETAAWRLTTY